MDIYEGIPKEDLINIINLQRSEIEVLKNTKLLQGASYERFRDVVKQRDELIKRNEKILKLYDQTIKREFNRDEWLEEYFKDKEKLTMKEACILFNRTPGALKSRARKNEIKIIKENNKLYVINTDRIRPVS